MKTIIVSGVIGEDVKADSFRQQFKSAGGDDIHLEINSPGGSVFQGKELLSIVRAYKGRVTAHVTGVAASMASALACVADSLSVDAQSVFMVHKTSGGARGNSDELEQTAEVLKRLDRQLADIYAAKTGRPAFEIMEDMASESWYYGQEILEHGFADEFIHNEVEGKLNRSTAIAQAQERFTAAFHQPSKFEIAAMAVKMGRTRGRKLTAEEEKLLSKMDITREEYLAAEERTDSEYNYARLPMQYDPQQFNWTGFSEEDKQAAVLSGMGPDEYREALKLMRSK